MNWIELNWIELNTWCLAVFMLLVICVVFRVLSCVVSSFLFFRPLYCLYLMIQASDYLFSIFKFVLLLLMPRLHRYIWYIELSYDCSHECHCRYIMWTQLSVYSVDNLIHFDYVGDVYMVDIWHNKYIIQLVMSLIV